MKHCPSYSKYSPDSIPMSRFPPFVSPMLLAGENFQNLLQLVEENIRMNRCWNNTYMHYLHAEHYEHMALHA